jgi:hypothetical protein
MALLAFSKIIGMAAAFLIQSRTISDISDGTVPAQIYAKAEQRVFLLFFSFMFSLRQFL